MYKSVITGKENASKYWNYIISMFLTSLMSILYACYICICLKTAIWLFLEQGLDFLIKTTWQPWLELHS